MVLSSPIVQAFSEHPLGLCGQRDPVRVVGNVKGLEQRLNILTLGVVLDVNPLSEKRWSVLVKLAEHWLLNPSAVAYKQSQQIQTAMQEMKILGPRHTSRVWWQICRGVQGRYKGSWRDLLTDGEDHVSVLMAYLEKNKATFPILAGPVISARWLDLVYRIGAVELSDWESLKVPLSDRQKKKARQIGVESDEIHPLLFNALYVWSTACRKLPVDSCGLGNCPKR